MKNICFYISIGLLFVISCNSEPKEENNNNDNEIIEIKSTDDSKNNENNEVSDGDQNEIKIDSQFKKFLGNFEKANLPYNIEPEEKLNYATIPLEYQAGYLTKAEDLNKKELEEMQAYAKFYYISNPITTDKFNGIVYGRSEMNASYYILCTFDNNGNIISHLEFALYQLIGAGPQAGQEYFIKGSIDKDLKVTIVSDDKTNIYQIGDDGKIKKM